MKITELPTLRIPPSSLSSAQNYPQNLLSTIFNLCYFFKAIKHFSYSLLISRFERKTEKKKFCITRLQTFSELHQLFSYICYRRWLVFKLLTPFQRNSHVMASFSIIQTKLSNIIVNNTHTSFMQKSPSDWLRRRKYLLWPRPA